MKIAKIKNNESAVLSIFSSEHVTEMTQRDFVLKGDHLPFYSRPEFSFHLLDLLGCKLGHFVFLSILLLWVMVGAVPSVGLAKNEILDSIICCDSVDMMNCFLTFQEPADLIFHHQPVLDYVSSLGPVRMFGLVQINVPIAEKSTSSPFWIIRSMLVIT